MEGQPAQAREPQHHAARTATHSANSRQAGQAVGSRGTRQRQRCMEDWPSGRLGMLGEAVNNWGQGTLDLDQVGSGPWAMDPSRQVAGVVRSRSVAVMLPTSPIQVPSSAGREQGRVPRQVRYFAVQGSAFYETDAE